MPVNGFESGMVQMTAIKLHMQHIEPSRATLFREENICCCIDLMTLALSDSGNKFPSISRDIRSFPSQK